jgi:preprotein translocase subunit SecA
LDEDVHAWVKEQAVDQEIFTDRLNALMDAKMGAKQEGIPAENWLQVEKQVLLQSLDHYWKEHLATLDALRQVVHLRAYAQKQPLNEYKAEAFQLFERMLKNVREDVTRMLAFAEFRMPEPTVLPNLPDFLKLDGGAGLAALPSERSFTFSDAGASSVPGVFAMGDALSPDELEAAQSVADQFGPEFVAADPESWQHTVSRNALCPCGSGKKFKHCHGLAA